MYIYIYIYIYTEREREIDIDMPSGRGGPAGDAEDVDGRQLVARGGGLPALYANIELYVVLHK